MRRAASDKMGSRQTFAATKSNDCYADEAVVQLGGFEDTQLSDTKEERFAFIGLPALTDGSVTFALMRSCRNRMEFHAGGFHVLHS